jgi:hypothetical protein
VSPYIEDAKKRNVSTMKTLYGLTEREMMKAERKHSLHAQQASNALHRRTDSKDQIRLDDHDGNPLTVTREDCTGDGSQIDKARARNYARAQNVWLKGLKKRNKGPTATSTGPGAFVHSDGASAPHVPALNCAKVG